MAGDLADLFHGGTDTGLLALIGVLGWFFKRQLKVYDKHLEECGETPKRVIMDQLSMLQLTVTKLMDSQHEQNTKLAILIGRQAERDHVR